MNTSPLQTACETIIGEVEKAIIGKRPLITKVLASFFTGGHVLFEDYPGLAKTLLSKSFAASLGLSFHRIQFTPDLLPGDITGSYVWDKEKSAFVLKKGPIFANIVLADEINRASPKTQSALLEAMEEGQVTIEGRTHKLPRPFMVLATQNPVEYEGTFPLPEAQLDRFSQKLSVGYPALEDELEILIRRKKRKQDEVAIEAVLSVSELASLFAESENVHIDEDIQCYIIQIVAETRKDSRITVGASPRASLALQKLACVHAAMQGRDYVIPDDIKHFADSVISHRVMLQPDFWMRKNASNEIVQSIFQAVKVPVLDGIK